MLKDRGAIATYVALCVSSSAILICAYLAASICNDIDNFYDEKTQQLVRLKVLTDDAWKEVMTVNQNKKHQEREGVFDTIFRPRRAATKLPDYCTCITPNRCPPGPPGKPGLDGLDGQNGLAGVRGASGLDAVEYELDEMGMPYDCIKCPRGPPGRKGPKGSMGKVGERGPKGTSGMKGRDGVVGSMGPRGNPGAVGKRGEKGRIGQKGKGGGIKAIPGPRGPKGQRGPIGPQGLPGQKGDSEEGPDGLPGLRGPQGLRGMPGPMGKPGERGSQGDPGPDASYCPCPKREVSEENAQKYVEPEAILVVVANSHPKRGDADNELLEYKADKVEDVGSTTHTPPTIKHDDDTAYSDIPRPPPLMITRLPEVAEFDEQTYETPIEVPDVELPETAALNHERR